MRLIRIFTAFVFVASMTLQARAQGTGLNAFDLNEKAISYLWNNLDSAEQYARFAHDVSGRHSDERAKAVNTLARIATIRMDYTQAWELYSSVAGITNNMLEIVGAEIGLMRICQRTSDNVSFYEYRNNILLHLRALHEESGVLNDAQMERLQSLERSFRMESALYWFELEQWGQAGREMAYVVPDNLLRNDHDRYLMYTYMHGLGIGVEAANLQELVLLRKLSERLMKRISRNFRFVLGFNSGLILLGAFGVLAPAASALLHNTSTLLLSMDCLTKLLPEQR